MHNVFRDLYITLGVIIITSIGYVAAVLFVHNRKIIIRPQDRVPFRVPEWEPDDYQFSDESEEEEEEYLVPFVFNDRKAKKNAPTCVICLTNGVICKNMPCGCSVMCGECATKLIKKTDICPTCRAKLKQIKVL